MLSKLTTKIALRKAGIPSSALKLSDASTFSGSKSSKDQNENLPFANPFANFQVPKALKSWQTPTPPPVDIAAPPMPGNRAPTCAQLKLPIIDGSRRPSIVVFLRHCGCPFAEKTFINLRKLANKYSSIAFLAVSHSSKQATDKWVNTLGGAWAVQIIIDEAREIYAQWGLGVSTTYYLLNPWTQMAVRKLGTEEGIWARDVDPSGNRWIVSGAWATDELGSIKWGEVSKTADDIPNLEEAVQSLEA